MLARERVIPLNDDELVRLRARVGELETQIGQLRAIDEIREVEMQSLEHEVALKAAYIERLERIEEEVVAPKDLHIRNLEAIIAELRSSAPQESQATDSKVSSISRIAGLRRRKS